MCRFISRSAHCGLMLAFTLVIAGCSWFGGVTTPKSTPTPSISVNSPTPTTHLPGRIESILDSIVFQTLIDESTNGWNPGNSGVLINWRRDDTTKVNCSAHACEVRGNAIRHDGQNDLRYLENMYWYKFRHPGDTSMDQYIARVLPTVKREWGNTIIHKGWIYYILLRLAQYSNDTAYWTNTAENWAAAQYTSIDPVLGLHHGPTNTDAGPDSIAIQDAYRVDLDLETGLALVDAGTRFNHPEWVTAGKREVDVVIKQTFNETYHLFGRIYLINDPTYGSNKVYDYQAKMGEQGQEIDALIRTGVYAHDTAYLTLAEHMLDALQSLPIHDTTHGGFYFKIYLGAFQGYSAGQVDVHAKELRQLHVLGALHLADVALGNHWASLESEMIRLVTTPNTFFMSAPVPGFYYRELPDFAAYPCSRCSPQPTENWISAESDGIALEAIQNVLSE